MKRWLKKQGRKLCRYLEPKCIPYQDEIVTSLILGTAALELARNECVEFASPGGTFGPIKLTGNTLPVFTYIVFEKDLMEFVAIRVEVAKPARITFIATIDSTTDPKRHGEQIEAKEAYKAPFNKLSMYLIRYFPFTRNTPGVSSDKPRVLKLEEALTELVHR